ncbi:MAG: M48 family metallopeptidase [Cyanobacteria bacterium J06639_1]
MRSFPPAPPSDSDHNAPTSNRQVLGVLGAFVSILLAIFIALGWLANNLVWFIPESVEVQLGRAVVPAFAASADQNSPIAAELDRLLDQLEENLPEDQRDRDYQVLYFDEDTVNAAAIPGDRVLMYRGLIAKAESENEVMMVMGHELGHFTNRDHLRGIARQLAFQTAIAIVVGDASGLTALGASVTQAIAGAQFSQGQELQADKVGLDLLNAHYGHVGGATAFFARLQDERPGSVDFLASHPVPRRRVRALENLIGDRGYARADLKPFEEPLAALQE